MRGIFRFDLISLSAFFYFIIGSMAESLVDLPDLLLYLFLVAFPRLFLLNGGRLDLLYDFFIVIAYLIIFMLPLQSLMALIVAYQ